MTVGLETFAKVRALHDSTTHAGEKAAAASRMEALARSAGMTVAEAISKLDAGATHGRPPSFDDLFDTPFFRQAKADRARERAEKWRRVVAEYGSEEAVFIPGLWERALAQACDRFVVKLETTGWRIGSLWGWDLFSSGDPAPQVVEAVSSAYPLPASVAAAWAEFAFWTKLASDREARAVGSGDPAPWVFARTLLIERMLDTMPAHSLDDMRGRMSWMDYRNDLETAPNPKEERVRLATLRADIERMGQRLRDQEAAPVQDEQQGYATWHTPSRSPDPGTGPTPVQNGHHPDLDDGPKSQPVSPAKAVQTAEAEVSAAAPPVQSGHPRRPTRAERNAAIRDLLAAGHKDREIARRLGISPTTVGAIRRDPEKYPAP